MMRCFVLTCAGQCRPLSKTVRFNTLKVIKNKTGEEFLIKTKHAVSKDQAGFILAGSALNLLARKGREMKEEITRSAELTD